jgi:hypothetical protein
MLAWEQFTTKSFVLSTKSFVYLAPLYHLPMLIENRSGDYSFLPGGAPYSSGVVASPGFELIHVTFRDPVPLAAAFEAMEARLQAQRRPMAALCALELRSPAPFSFEGFAEFNDGYRTLLKKYSMLQDGPNPIARTNVAPLVGAPSEAVVYAFTYSVPEQSSRAGRSFVVSGAGELENSALDARAICRAGEYSDAAMAEKASLVMGIMKERLVGLGTSWEEVTAVDVYTIHNVHPLLETEILAQTGSAARHGIRWHYTRPPVTGIEFEMDVRGVRSEEML